LFAVIPRARWATKLWADERFVEAAKRISADTGLVALLIGGTSDVKSLDEMRAAIGGRAASLAGRTDLLELAEVLRLSRCVVTVDSGPMHLAAAVGARVVALFGPTAANRTGPYGKGHRVVRKGLACSPCFRRRCPDARCMMEITVDDVVRAVEEVLKER
jgi:ADP-heptose:LPS heptosyltransferase